MTSPTTSAPQLSPVAAPAPAQSPVTAAAPAAAELEQRRDPEAMRPFPSITDFIVEDPGAKLPELIPTPSKAPFTNLLNPHDTNLLRPPSTSPLESEVEEESENTRLVSIEEFLRQDQEPSYRTQQVSPESLTSFEIVHSALQNELGTL